MPRANEASRTAKGRRKEKIHGRTVALRLLVAACVVITVAWFGRHLGAEIKVMEAWITGLGLWGPIVFVIFVIMFTSMFVPDTLLAVAAGVMFGLIWGTLLMIIGAVTTATLNYLLARKLFQARIENALENHPKLRRIQRMVGQDGFRLQLLLRLSLVNPVLVSYVLGAANVRYVTFLSATAGLIPALFVEVYFGHLALHVTKVAGNASSHSSMHTVVTAAGFAMSIAVMIFIVWAATRALTEEGGHLSIQADDAEG